MNAPSVFHRRQPAFAVRAAAQDEAEILLYDEIGTWFIAAQDFVKELNAITAGTIHLRINSPGGDVFQGIAIYNALKAHRAKVVVHVDGIAASIASIIALAGDEILIAKNAMLMIHKATALAWGTAEGLRRTAEMLDKLENATIVSTYVDATGQSEDQIRTWMEAETWFDAEEAVDHGFCDEVEDHEGAKARFDLSVYNNVPSHLAATAKPDRRDAERILRDAGYSRSAAKRQLAARATTPAPAVRDALDPGVLDSLRQLTEKL
jgi:ATP-dependent Clp protease protease subunit